jgi:hypothetical protein
MARGKDNALRTLQANLNAGELSPRLLARMDTPLYQTGLALCRNFIPGLHGGVRNRTGTKFVAYIKNVSAKPRLVPFRFSAGTGQNYILCFENLVLRVFMNGAQVLYSSGPSIGLPVEVVTPYTTADLAALNWTQSADVMTLVHPGYAPRELTRTAHDAWTLTTITFAPTLTAPVNADVALAKGGAGTGTDWKYKVTWETETGEESLPGPVETQDHASSLSSTNYVDITVSNYPAAAVYADIYRLRGGTYGWIGSTADGSFRDEGISPDLSSTPPRSRNPFSGASNYPSAVAYYQQRLAFAGSYNSPETIWLSQTGAYKNFSISEPLRDSDAITATLAGQNVDQIRHLVPMKSLLILCKGGVWSMDRGDQGLKPSLEGGLTSQLAEGSSLLRPIMAGNDCLYVQEGGRSVRAIDFDVGRDGLAGEDVSLLAEHLLRDSPAVDWAWASNPDRVVWIVREDGVLLSLSYLRDQRVFGWAQHNTGASGTFECVASIPESDGDAVYFVVRRLLGGTYRRCVERLVARFFPIVQDSYFVDCGLSLDLPLTITGVSVSVTNVIVTVTAHGLVAGDLVDVGAIEGLEGINDRRLVVGTPITADTFALYVSGEDLDLPADQALTSADVTGSYLQGGTVLKAVTTVSGLTHLNGESVSVLADGSVEGPYTVASGAVTLQRPATRVHVGLPITATIRTLPIASAASAEMRARRKRVTRLKLFIESARGIWAGPSLDALEEYIQRTDELLGDPTRLASGMVELTIPSTWNEHGQIYVRSVDPLPLELLGIEPELEVGSD